MTTSSSTRPRRTRRPSAVTLLACVLALLGTACTGPREPLEVGIREVASDIVLGTQGRSTPAPPVASPVPPAPVAVNIPTPARLPAPPRFEPTPTPTPTPEDPCPEAFPLSVPRHEAPDNEGLPPVPEALEFRNEGTFTVTGPNANEGVFDQPTTRVVQDVDGERGEDVTYDVVAELGGTTTTTSYLVRNVARVDDPLGVFEQANVDEQRGLFLTRVHSLLPDGSESTFAPADPVRLVRFPISKDDTFDVTATDPVTGTVMSFTSTVLGRSRVDACGEFVATHQVQLTEGQILGPNQQVDFAATYDVAMQYGGLIVRDQVVLSGTEGADTVTRTNIATVSRVPTHLTEVAS